MICLMPNIWVLNGRFITHVERQEAEQRVSPSVRSIIMQQRRQLRSSLQENPCKFRLLNSLGDDFQLQSGPGGSDAHAGHNGREGGGGQGHAFMKTLSHQPSQGPARDIFRLQYLAIFHDHEAIRYNTALSHQVSLQSIVTTK